MPNGTFKKGSVHTKGKKGGGLFPSKAERERKKKAREISKGNNGKKKKPKERMKYERGYGPGSKEFETMKRKKKTGKG